MGRQRGGLGHVHHHRGHRHSVIARQPGGGAIHHAHAELAGGSGATSYTVYLDMSNPPQQHYTVSGASFTPSAALEGGDLYYWYVVGNNGSLSGPASATWSFWVTGAPSLVSVTPASGGPPAGGLGTPTSFDFRFSSPNGWQDIGWTEMEFNYYNIGAGACFIGVWPGSGQVALSTMPARLAMDRKPGADAGDTAQQPVLGEPGAVVDDRGVAGADQGDLLLTFLAGLPGPQQIWMQAGDARGYGSWQQMGTWTTSTVAFQGAVDGFRDDAGAAGVGRNVYVPGVQPQRVRLLHPVGHGVQPRPGDSLYPAPHACYVDYNRLTNALTLMSDSTGQWDSTVQQAQWGSGGTIQNSQCTVNAGGVLDAGGGHQHAAIEPGGDVQLRVGGDHANRLLLCVGPGPGGLGLADGGELQHQYADDHDHQCAGRCAGHGRRGGMYDAVHV